MISNVAGCLLKDISKHGNLVLLSISLVFHPIKFITMAKDFLGEWKFFVKCLLLAEKRSLEQVNTP